MKSKSEIFNSHKTIVDGKEVLTYGNAIKAMEELESQFRQSDVSGRREQLGIDGLKRVAKTTKDSWSRQIAEQFLYEIEEIANDH